MFEVFDRSLKKQAVLHLAYGREEHLKLNGVSQIKFRLPGDDPKNEFCQPFSFIHDGDGQYYRILSDGADVGDTGERTYTAEHGIATLVDDVMFGGHIIGGIGYTTRTAINYILGYQTTKHWQLGVCDFSHNYEYALESENLLNALFSIPNLFAAKYKWTFDMATRPWTVSLRRLDESQAPAFYIRAGKNLIASSATRTGTDLCTRLYLLGSGEGNNQVTIRDANGGVPYLQSPQAYIAKYGLISKVYVDRQFEDAASLKARGQTLLAQMQEPQYKRSYKVSDLYKITQQDYDRAQVGDIVRLADDGTTTFVTGVKRSLDEDKDGDMTIEMSTVPDSLAADIADIADRQRIEQVYSQGATQIYAQSIQTNADARTAAVLSFYIPEEMRIVNKVMARITLAQFRSYNRTTSGGGKSVNTSSSGGGSAQTSSASGAVNKATSAASNTTVSAPQTLTLDYEGSGFNTDASSITVTGEPHTSYSRVTGGSFDETWNPSPTTTSSANGSSGQHSHAMLHTHSMGGHTHPIGTHRHFMSHTHSMWHQHRVVGHSHTIPAHSHTLEAPAHTHSVSIPAHTHELNLPDHTHTIEQGIYRFGSPKSAQIQIGGTTMATMTDEKEIDLTNLLLNSSGKIPRNSWIRLGVLPDDLAYVTIDLFIQGFVQSRGGGYY